MPRKNRDEYNAYMQKYMAQRRAAAKIKPVRTYEPRSLNESKVVNPDPVNPGPVNPKAVNPEAVKQADPVNPCPVNPGPVNPGSIRHAFATRQARSVNPEAVNPINPVNPGPVNPVKPLDPQTKARLRKIYAARKTSINDADRAGLSQRINEIAEKHGLSQEDIETICEKKVEATP